MRQRLSRRVANDDWSSQTIVSVTLREWLTPQMPEGEGRLETGFVDTEYDFESSPLGSRKEVIQGLTSCAAAPGRDCRAGRGSFAPVSSSV